MKVRVQLTAEVTEEDRRMIAWHMDKSRGAGRIAPIAEIREFYRRYGIEVGRKVIDAMLEINAAKAPVAGDYQDQVA